VAPGWSVQELDAIVDGSAILTLSSEDQRTARIRICRNDGQPQGIAHTSHLDLLLINGGNGATPSEEEVARVVLCLAHGIQGSASRLVSQLRPSGGRVKRG
jgi:hypothetical protein